MTKTEMVEICDMLSGAYRWMDFSNKQTFAIWYEQLKQYDFPEVRQGVINWSAYNAKEPTPADILDATKNVRIANRKIAQDSMAWNTAVRCPKCNDKGFVLIKYPSDYEEMRVCDCAAARQEFGYCFTEDYDRKAKQIQEREKPYGDGWWKDMRYKFEIDVDKQKEAEVRELWTKKRFREIRKVERSGLVVMNVVEISRK